MSEIKRIMDMLGRTELDGDVKGSHFGKILMYLQKTKDEAIDQTKYKLAVIVGMSARNIMDNYIKGLIYLGVIKTYQNGNMYRWKWIGEDALNSVIDLRESPEPPKKGKKEKKLEDKIEEQIEKGSKKPFTDAVKETKKRGKKK